VVLTAPTVENLTLNITEEIHVRASIDATFEALLEQMGPANEAPDGTPLPMTIEPRPGGRWFRDLGNDGAGMDTSARACAPAGRGHAEQSLKEP
jgi:hypothetical protein